MSHYLTVRERCFRALEERLREITIVNDYSCDVNAVHRDGTLPGRCNNPPELFILEEKSEEFVRSTHHLAEQTTFSVWCERNGTDYGADAAANALLGDVQRALALGRPLFDTSYPISPQEVYVICDTNQTFVLDQEGGIFVGIKRILEYSYLLTDPRKWDDTDILVKNPDFP